MLHSATAGWLRRLGFGALAAICAAGCVQTWLDARAAHAIAGERTELRVLQTQAGAVSASLHRAREQSLAFLLSSAPVHRAQFEAARADVMASVEALLRAPRPQEAVQRFVSSSSGELARLVAALELVGRGQTRDGLALALPNANATATARSETVVAADEPGAGLAQELKSRLARLDVQHAQLMTRLPLAATVAVLALVALLIHTLGSHAAAERRHAQAHALGAARLREGAEREDALFRELQDRRRAEETAQAASIAKSAFLANMSHEIRTPMNAILGLTHLAMKDTHDAFQRERLRKIDGAAKHLLHVISDVLDLSKIESGKFTLEDIPFHRDDVVSTAFEMVTGKAAEKGIELIFDTDHLPSRLRGDPQRMAQALINLLSNAVKFTERGWVRLQGERLAIDGDRLLLRFSVRDTGVGVAKHRQAALFNAFEQADSSVTRRHGGTGLGLALTRHITELMGGEVGVESEPGRGSTFWFTAWVGCPDPESLRPMAAPWAGRRALLIDDLPEALAAVGNTLHRLGLEVDPHPSGQAAVRRVQSASLQDGAVDVVLIDWGMDPLSGSALLADLRRAFGSCVPPCVLLSAFDGPHLWQQASAGQVQEVLIKPITPSALHDTLTRVLRGEGKSASERLEPKSAPGAELQRLHTGRRVLLVEDNAINQQVASELLTSAGLLVEVADNGSKAVRLALSRDYDLVLMDIQMPEMDGVSATRAIRSRAGPKMPIIAMTANAFVEDREASLEAGMNDHISKPVDAELFYTTLLRWLPDPTPVTGVSTSSIATTGAESEPTSLPLMERLAAVQGLDTDQLLRTLGKQTATVERVLRGFVDHYSPQGVPDFQLPGSDAVFARWRTLSHSLRGACAAIGATGLQSDLLKLEQDLSQAADRSALQADAARIQAALLRLVQQLAAALDAV